MSKKRGLGRGLEALIPAQEKGTQAIIRQIAVQAIRPNPHQPRDAMDEEQLAELAESIRTHGLLQPLIVSEEQGVFTLIAGERRWRAGRMAGLDTLPAIVKETTPQEMLELALVENIQRADLNPLEEALAYKQLAEEFGLTQEAIAERVGKGRSTVANLLRLLNLPLAAQQAISDGRLSAAHGRALLSLPDEERQLALLDRVLAGELNVRQTWALAEAMAVEKKKRPRPAPELPPFLASLQSEFETSLGTRVNIEQKAKGGRVVIYYYSDEELQAIYDNIVNE